MVFALVQSMSETMPVHHICHPKITSVHIMFAYSLLICKACERYCLYTIFVPHTKPGCISCLHVFFSFCKCMHQPFSCALHLPPVYITRVNIMFACNLPSCNSCAKQCLYTTFTTHRKDAGYSVYSALEMLSKYVEIFN